MNLIAITSTKQTTTDETSSLEKAYTQQVEHAEGEDHTLAGVSMDPGLPVHLDTLAFRRGIRKVDFFVTGVVLMLYLFSFLDKANYGNARVAGLQKDLGLSSNQWSLTLTVLYFPYMAAEIPANLALKHIGPHILLPSLTLAFGVICTMQGFVRSYGSLLACRVLLGAAEGGLLCGIVLYMSTFYRRDQFQLRASFLLSATSLAGAFSGLLAAAIAKLDGKCGQPGWAWIFFLEGTATCLFAITAYFFMAPNYEKAWWLKANEKAALRAAYNATGRGAEADAHFSWAEVILAFKSPFLLCMLPVYFSNGLILFGLAYFAPTMVAAMGYDTIQTQFHSVPPYAVVFVVAVVSSYYSDKYAVRGLNVAIFGGIAVIGYGVNLGTDPSQTKARYAGLFLQAFGGYAPSPVLSSWLVDNMAPYYTRGTAIGAAYMSTQVGGIISTWIYPTSQSPRYQTGAAVSMAAAAIECLLPIFMIYYLSRQNKLRAAKLASLPADFVHDDGPIKYTDIRFKFVV